MKNIHDVLRQKELEIQQIQREIEALRLAARLLADDTDTDTATVRPSITSAAAPRPASVIAKPAEAAYAVPQTGIRQFP
jgi:hypothetical protein